MSSKTGKAGKVKLGHGRKVKPEALRVLRTVNANESFRFYEGIGKPTGQIATSLADFLNKIKSVKTESLMFHLERKDFENWIEKTLGDFTLAKRIAKMSFKRDRNVKAKMQAILEKRIKELNDPCLTMMINADLTLTPKHSMP